MKKVLLIVNNAPFGSIFAAEALRAGIALGGMDLKARLVFKGDGVFCLIKKQKSDIFEMTDMSEGFKNADEFGLKLFVRKKSLSERGIKQNDIISVKSASDNEIGRFIEEADTIINF